ncbi:MAG: CoB--CoM heterodisulfide reductase iron-sulfur subunit A family protein [Candidatus Rokubacteria bacterium]|nr:CoB--CoM heterodisulfide reductase iron-sulfur subunit A family protein [Candidatus Rokubacteria bacterium]MBI2493462.1 CoB--CoM heterodisulfide reductase iron-sulfur subunit A family protein [Candidatus Rokubacteria bacterium]
MPSDAVLVLGGGPAGLEAARGVADLGHRAILVEQRERLGGQPDAAQYAALTHGMRPAEEAIGEMVAAVTGRPEVEIRLKSGLTGFRGSAGDFTATLATPEGAREVGCGAVIVATGFQHFDPGRETQMYGYYEYDDVITLTDAEKMLKAGKFVKPSNGQPPERVCFIQCVGSRDRQIGNEYCSKVCCGISSKQAIEVRQLLPKAKVFIFYIDMRMYGYWENELYWPAQEKYKVQYIRGIVTEVLKKGDRLLIRGEDTTMGRPMEVAMDVVVLAVGMEPSAGTRAVAQLLGVRQNKYGFVEVPPGSLDPVATSVPGVFVAGAAAGPMDLNDTMGTAGAAALRAATLLRRVARAGAAAR